MRLIEEFGMLSYPWIFTNVIIFIIPNTSSGEINIFFFVTLLSSWIEILTCGKSFPGLAVNWSFIISLNSSSLTSVAQLLVFCVAGGDLSYKISGFKLKVLVNLSPAD